MPKDFEWTYLYVCARRPPKVSARTDSAQYCKTALGPTFLDSGHLKRAQALIRHAICGLVISKRSVAPIL